MTSRTVQKIIGGLFVFLGGSVLLGQVIVLGAVLWGGGNVSMLLLLPMLLGVPFLIIGSVFLVIARRSAQREKQARAQGVAVQGTVVAHRATAFRVNGVRRYCVVVAAEDGQTYVSQGMPPQRLQAVMPVGSPATVYVLREDPTHYWVDVSACEG